MGNALVRLLQRTIPALRQHEHQLAVVLAEKERLKVEKQELEHQRQRQEKQLELLEKEKLQQGVAIAVLKNENLELAGLVETVRHKLRSTSLKFWLSLGVGAAVALVLYSRWRRERAARTLAEYRMRLLEVPDNIQCVVCMEAPRDELLDPCGHVCVCGDCVESLAEEEGLPFRCPVCRSWVLGTRKVYMA